MSAQNEKPERKKSGVVLAVLLAVCAVVLAFALYKVISIQTNYKRAQNEYSSLRQYTRPTEKSEEEELTPEPAETAETKEESSVSKTEEPEEKPKSEVKKIETKAPIEVDHAALSTINSDYIGWLYIEALDISYPIMHGATDNTYLHTSFEGASLFAGSLFINAESSTDFSDPHTVIYGHNMKDGTMFGRLNLLFSQDLYQDYPYFWILTPEGDRCYRIFSMQYCNAVSRVYTLFGGRGDNVADYIEEMWAASLVDTGELDCNKDSKVVTLSTCVGESGPGRFVVQGILVEP